MDEKERLAAEVAKLTAALERMTADRDHWAREYEALKALATLTVQGAHQDLKATRAELDSLRVREALTPPR